MARLVPIASGKGGVGKSAVAANLGLALTRPGGRAGPGRPARGGGTVVLVDLDLGGSNLHTFLGVRNRHAGVGTFIWKRGETFEELLVETGFERLWLIPGDGLLPGTANLEWFAKKRILKGLESLPADYVLLDLGAGSSYNVVDFFLSSNEGLVVIKPEITSILNAYALLKTVAFRVLCRSFPERSAGRAMVNEFAARKGEDAGLSFLDFSRDLASKFPEGQAARDRLSALRPRAVMNMGGSASDAALCHRLRDIAAKNLGLSIEFAGYIADDPALPPSVAARRPLVDLDPDCPFSTGIGALADWLAAHPSSAPLRLRDCDEELDRMIAEGGRK